MCPVYGPVYGFSTGWFARYLGWLIRCHSLSEHTYHHCWNRSPGHTNLKMTLKTSTNTKKDRAGGYGSISNNHSKGIIDEESQELPLLSRPQQFAGPLSTQPSSKPVPTSAAAEISNDQQSYGTSFQLDETSSTHVSSLLDTKTRAITTTNNSGGNNGTLRQIAMRLSLYVNLAILAGKAYVYVKTLSLAVLAALLDSLLDVVSQLVLYYTERTSDLRSSEIYPAGAARLALLFSKKSK